tara:strand:- start:826 stop:1422 length:597 start_codon:yes stop_codon:yes gene_type:complete
MEATILNDIESQSCIICLKDDLLNENMCSTGCSHLFCKECLDRWLDKGKKTCPLCRRTIQYFKNNDVNYRVVIHPNSGSSNNTSNSGNTTPRDTISRDTVQDIIRRYYNMRYIMFIMSLVMIAGYTGYAGLIDRYNHLRNLYIMGQNNITLLNEELDKCHSFNDKEILVDIWLGIDNGINNIKKCMISMISYKLCIQE